MNTLLQYPRSLSSIHNRVEDPFSAYPSTCTISNLRFPSISIGGGGVGTIRNLTG